jgi:hypothetical protein
MASASYTLDRLDDTDQVVTLVGNTNRGAEYRDTTRALSLPYSLTIENQVGNSGAKGNDHVKIKISNTVADADGVTAVGSISVDLSIPRNTGWTGTNSDDLLAVLASFLSDARIASLGDALVP